MGIHCTQPGLEQVFLRPFLNFSVGMFLFLSGWLSNAERWHWKKRLWRVGVPYVVWSLVYCALSNLRTPGEIPLRFLEALLLANATVPFYFIAVYVQLTLLIPVADWFARNERLRYLPFLVSPIEIVLVRMVPMLFGVEVCGWFAAVVQMSCAGWVSYFYFGYLLGNGRMRIEIGYGRLAVLIMLGLGVQMAEGYWMYTLGIEHCGTQLKLSAVATGMLVCLFLDRVVREGRVVRGCGWLGWLGDCSFGIYFVHLGVIAVCCKRLARIGVDCFAVRVAVVVAVSAGLCWAWRVGWGWVRGRDRQACLI